MDVNRPMTMDGPMAASSGPAAINAAGPAAGPGPLPGPLPGATDAELAVRVAGGDRAAGGVLVDRYHGHVRRFLGRLVGRADVADDLAQETFVRMLRYADRYDPRYPMRTWLLTIARRLSINAGQRGKRMIASESFDHNAHDGPGPAAIAARSDHNAALRRALATALTTLTEAQRQAIVLFHQQELSVQEVAQVMGLPVGTVKSHLHRGRAAMRKVLEPMHEVNTP